MLLETAIIAGVKALAAHGGLTAWLAGHAVSTATTAGIATAVAQTAGTVAAIGVAATAVDGTVRIVEGAVDGKPLAVAHGLAKVAGAGTGVH